MIGGRRGVQRVCPGFLAQINHVHRADFRGLNRIPTVGGPGRGARSPAAMPAVLFFFLGAGKGTLFFQQRYAVGNRDLVVIRVDFRKGQKAMAVSAIIHEGRLQRRLDPRYLCEVDIPRKLAFVDGFKIEFLNFVSVDHDHPSFLGVGGIDKHLPDHDIPMNRPDDPARSKLRADGLVVAGCLFGQDAARGNADRCLSGTLHADSLSLRASSRFCPG